MQGGLLKSASAVALFAAAGLFGASPAKAADLGGDCCADLEERVAELEATTVRKGNRKVSLTLSGFVSHHVMWWNDGTQSDMYIGDGGNYGSRFRFVGTAKISPQLSAGFLYEFQANANAIGSTNQLNGGDDLGTTGGVAGNTACGLQTGNSSNSPGCIVMRQSVAYLKHNQLGTVKIGHGSTATDDLTLIDVAGYVGAATSDVGLYGGGMMLRSNAGLLANATAVNWSAAIRGHESWDTSRRNNILYETPTLAGFYLQGAVAEDNYWDVALRYAGEFGGFRVAGGIGYGEDTKFNSPNQLPTDTAAAQAGNLCQNDRPFTLSAATGAINNNGQSFGKCDVKVTDLKGSLSVMHVPTGLFLTGAGGKREIDGSRDGTALGRYNGPDLTFWWLAGGISQNFFGFGKTVLFGEYGIHKGGLEQSAFLTGTQNVSTGAFTPLYNPNTVGSGTSSSEVTTWGLGVTQHIDAAAMEVFAAYKNYSLDANGFTGANASLNKGASGVHDLQMVIIGTRISF